MYLIFRLVACHYIILMSGYRPNLACVKTLRSVRRSNEEKKAFFFFRTDCSTARRPRSVLCCDILINRTLRPRSIGPYTTLNPPSIDFQLTSLYQHKRTRQGGPGRWPPILEKFSKMLVNNGLRVGQRPTFFLPVPLCLSALMVDW